MGVTSHGGPFRKTLRESVPLVSVSKPATGPLIRLACLIVMPLTQPGRDSLFVLAVRKLSE